jgi:tetratricopeptide (TPR) repeat protein
VGEAARRITHQQPARPRSIRRIPFDLETIILKALEKEPARRYQSASSLLEDLERWFEGLPILAHPPSAFYQLRKLAGRHKSAAAVFLLLLSLLLAAGPAFYFLKLRQARDIAEERDAAAAVLDFQKRMLTAPMPSVDGRLVRLRDVLDRSSRRIEREYAGRPKIELLLCGVVGRAYASIGLPEKAEAELARALRMSESIHGEGHPATRALRESLADLRER